MVDQAKNTSEKVTTIGLNKKAGNHNFSQNALGSSF